MFRTTNRLAAFAVAACLTVGLGACGSSGNSTASDAKGSDVEKTSVDSQAPETDAVPEESTPATSAMTPADLVQAADAICTRVRAEMNAVAQPDTMQAAATSYELLRTISEKGRQEFLDLPVGTSDKPTIALVAQILDEANVALGSSASAATKGDTAAIESANAIYATKVEEFRVATRRAGFEQCAVRPRAETISTEAASSSAGASTGSLQVVELADVLKPIAGQEFVALAENVRAELISGFENDASVVELAHTVGTSTTTNGTNEALLIFVGLKRPLVGGELNDFITGVVGQGTNVQQGEVMGTRGWTYTDSGGSPAFVTVRNTTAILSLADTEEYLGTVISGLLAANPEL